jgi:hypothetical protein
MPFQLANRVRETSTTTGTGNFTLTGPVTGYRSFNASITSGNTLYYTIAVQGGSDWEVGIGTFTATATLARTQVVSNSLGTTALINFGAGTKDVFIDLPSEYAVTQADVGTNPNQVPLNQYLGDLAYMDVVNTISGNPYYDTAISDVQPTLNLDFVNSKTLDSRITFARASNIATFYDAKSSAVAEQNLLVRSQEFDNASWVKTNLTSVVGGATAPDGTTTGYTVQLNASTGVQKTIVQGSTATLSPITQSVYLKAGTHNFVQIALGGSTGLYANFDLSGAGAVGTGGLSSVSSITQVGTTGWFRCVMPNAAITANGIVYICAVDSASATFVPNTSATGTFLIWGAQNEQRSSATAYNATTTTALNNYIPTLQTAAANVARFDYDPITRLPNGLLIEEQRTNTQLYSTFTTGWVTQGSTSTAAANIAPDGTQTAIRVAEDTVNTTHAVYYGGTTTITGSTIYTYSVYAKASGRSFLALQINEGGVVIASWVSVNLTNGSVGSIAGLTGGGLASASATATAVGNGWYRCTLTWTSNAGSTSIQPYVGAALDASTRVYTGNGFSGVFLWGAQLEIGSFPTTYIPTVGSQGTRASDSVSMTGTNFSSWYNNAQGSVFVQFSNPVLSLGGNYRVLGLYAGNTTTGIVEVFTTPATVQIQNPTITGMANNIILARVPKKIAVSATSGNSAVSIDGGAVSTSTQTWLTTPDRLAIGSLNSQQQYINGNIQKIQYYPLALSNAELQEMTS